MSPPSSMPPAGGLRDDPDSRLEAVVGRLAASTKWRTAALRPIGLYGISYPRYVANPLFERRIPLAGIDLEQGLPRAVRSGRALHADLGAALPRRLPRGLAGGVPSGGAIP